MCFSTFGMFAQSCHCMGTSEQFSNERSGKFMTLVASNVAARGLDINDVQLIIQAPSSFGIIFDSHSIDDRAYISLDFRYAFWCPEEIPAEEKSRVREGSYSHTDGNGVVFDVAPKIWILFSFFGRECSKCKLRGGNNIAASRVRDRSRGEDLAMGGGGGSFGGRGGGKVIRTPVP
ncbi:hypothetical protein NL676_029721 [Syzygium grande]|nr:hypothetical protein NL676_029721 [Syzygium grande]